MHDSCQHIQNWYTTRDVSETAWVSQPVSMHAYKQYDCKGVDVLPNNCCHPLRCGKQGKPNRRETGESFVDQMDTLNPRCQVHVRLPLRPPTSCAMTNLRHFIIATSSSKHEACARENIVFGQVGSKSPSGFEWPARTLPVRPQPMPSPR